MMKDTKNSINGLKGIDAEKISISDFQDWVNEKTVNFAKHIHNTGYKTIDASFSGTYIVTCNDQIVYKGMQLLDAVRMYNQIEF